MNIEKMKVNEVSDETLVNYLKNKGYDIKQSDNKLPKTWEELEEISGYYVDADTFGWVIHGTKTSHFNKNTFRTKEQAEASTALAQLSQLMFVYNKGWRPDWKNTNEKKHCILFNVGTPSPLKLFTLQRFLAFKTEKIRDKFLENFENLIRQAKPLL